MALAHSRGILSKEKWIYNGRTGSGLEIYEHKENGLINIYNPITGEMIED